MLCAGAPTQLREKLSLGKPDEYRYLSGCTQYFANSETDKKILPTQKSKHHQVNGPLKDPILDDLKDFVQLDKGKR